MGYGLNDLGSIPGRDKKLFSTSQHPDHLWDPFSLLPPVVKQTGPEDDYSSAFIFQVEKCGAIPPLPHTS
jgi:hypothetical protein